VVAGLGSYLGWRSLGVTDVATGVGELCSVVLPDHSVVELNTHSEIRFDFNPTERRVELVRGEAFFVVAKDPGRPFVVVTDVATARAVGTRFSVYRRPAGTLVTVAEGKVLVRDLSGIRQSSASTGVSAVEVVPGEQAEAQPGKPVVMHQAALQRSLAWREHRLIFAGEPLANVVEEFNRYNVTVLTITEPRLRDQRISGVFDANDPESLIDFLVKVDHIPMSRAIRGQVRIGAGQRE
jgi:transmembrane sensor